MPRGNTGTVRGVVPRAPRKRRAAGRRAASGMSAHALEQQLATLRSGRRKRRPVARYLTKRSVPRDDDSTREAPVTVTRFSPPSMLTYSSPSAAVAPQYARVMPTAPTVSVLPLVL